jgi:hypothetical protein
MTVFSLDEYISNVTLKKRIPRKKAEENLPNNSDFRRELASVYQDMGYKAAFFKSSCQHYGLACFSVEETQYSLHVGEVVTIISEEEGESYAILRSIFSHERNDQRFAFIVISRFEITNLMKLECPVYKFRDTRQICSISVVDTTSTVHFVHCCINDECTGDSGHDFGNNLYIRNMYFFKAV